MADSGRHDGWLLRVGAASGAHARRLGERLVALGAGAVTLLPQADQQELYEPPPSGVVDWAGRTEVQGLFADLQGARSAAAALGEMCGAAVHLAPCAAQDWVARSRAGVAPRHFGGRLWIVPPWQAAPDAHALSVVLEPGLAFGTGRHPSTALCLEWLAGAELVGRSVIDFGAGSGVLAIAAARLGAGRVTAVDNDPQACRSARANAARNGVAVRVCSPERLGREHAAIVLANILARPLVELAPELTARCEIGGRLVLSGIDEAQADVVAAVYSGSARLVGRASRDGWVRLELLRTP